MSISSLPSPLRRYVATHTKRKSKLRRQLVQLLQLIVCGGKVRYKDIKKFGVRYHIDRMRKLGLLTIVYENGAGYIALSPTVLADNIRLILLS
ncbi:MAG: hypothetical protein QXE66_05615 [Desulfurococcaceae archaeon]